jgi:hypothetical protein
MNHTEGENQDQAQAPPKVDYMKMLDDALADPNTPEETRREILDSQARLAAQKAGGAYTSAQLAANRYAHVQEKK